MPDDSADCVLSDGQVLDLSTATAEQLSGCRVQTGTILRLEDGGDGGEGNPDLPISAPAASPLPLPRPPPIYPLPQGNNVEPVLTPDATPTAPAPALPAPAAEEAPVASELVEQTSTSPTAGELGDLIASSGGGALGLAAALIAVVGGTAGFKLWTKISEQKHEQQMKRLDIDQANAGLQGAQPPPCQAAHHTLLAEIKAINAKLADQEARLAKTEKASSGFDPSVDVGDLEDRVEALEKSFRKKARATVGGE